MEKQFNHDLWKPLGIKPINVSDFSTKRKPNSFPSYQAHDDRYEVRGIMPPSNPSNKNTWR